ncbi:hypothetical protein QTP86_005359 [Hemibagrus guttatus]|nr:hypothetical protein QTP86_005359 [Hemibagrus guttatus]
MLRFSLGVTRLDRIRNEYIRGTAHVGRLGDKVREARLRWFGHVQRREKSLVTGFPDKSSSFFISNWHKRPRLDALAAFKLYFITVKNQSRAIRTTPELPVFRVSSVTTRSTPGRSLVAWWCSLMLWMDLCGKPVTRRQPWTEPLWDYNTITDLLLHLVTQMRMGSLLSLVPLKVSSSYHHREFFLATVTLTGFRPPAIPGEGAAFHAVVAAPSAAYRYVAVLTLQISHKVSDGLSRSKKAE